jgi:hypothetical protein
MTVRFNGLKNVKAYISQGVNWQLATGEIIPNNEAAALNKQYRVDDPNASIFVVVRPESADSPSFEI